MPACALCQNEYPTLNQSHIIPKLVYKRIKSHPQSRFRDLGNISNIMQDGEKHKMLCHDCEEKFCALETNFAKHFLDDYLRTGRIPNININEGWMGNYILSVAWRILNDDLYRLNSFSGEWLRPLFETFELQLRTHLNKQQIPETIPSFTKNYVFKLSEILQDISCQKLLEKMIFGYTYFDGDYKSFVVFSSYAGLVCATQLIPNEAAMLLIDPSVSLHKLMIDMLRGKRQNLVLSLRKLSLIHI